MENENTVLAGRKYLKVVGILLIVFGGISTVVTLISVPVLLGAIALFSIYYGGGVVILTYVVVIFSVAAAAFMLVTGILGVKNSRVKEKAGTCAKFAILLMALAVASEILTIVYSLSTDQEISIVGSVFSLALGLVLPILFYIGAKKNMESPE